MQLGGKMAKSKREFGEGPLYTIADYIIWFLMGNLYFLLLNIPLLIVLVVLLSNGTNPLPQGFAYIIIVCCIPIGPSVTALLSVMGKLVREKDLTITKDFFRAYKVNFSQSLFFGTIETIILSILYFDIKFFNSSSYPRILIVFVLIVMGFIFLVSLHVFPIVSRFYFSKKDILKISANYTIMKFNITILHFAILLTVGFIFLKISSLIFICAFSIACYLIMFYEQKILLDIEEKFVDKTV